MEIASVGHKHLKAFLEDQTVKGLPPTIITRLRRALVALVEANNIAELATFPQWRVHMLKGDRHGDWSVTVTGNWRLTFRLIDDAVHNLNLEGYHQ